MKKFQVCLLALFVLSFILLPVVVFADTVNVTLTGAGGPNRDNDGAYYIAPYSLSINGAAAVNAFCVDFYHEAYVPQNWTAYVTPVAIGSDWSNTYQAVNGSKNYSETYAAMAYLASIYGNYSDLNTRIDIQHALWDLSSGQPKSSPSGMQYMDANALYWFNQGWANYNTMWTSGWVILTDTRGIQNGTQEFLTQGPVPTPEPATMLLLGSGLVGLIGFRKKFKK